MAADLGHSLEGCWCSGRWHFQCHLPEQRLASVREEVKQPVTQGGAEAKGGQFAHWMLRDDSVECRAQVQKQHSHMCVPFLLDVRGLGWVQRRWRPPLSVLAGKQTGTSRMAWWYHSLDQRGVEDVCENPYQLVSTFFEHPSWYVIEAHWFLGAHSPQGSPEISCVKTEWLLIQARNRFSCRSGVECIKPSKVVI